MLVCVLTSAVLAGGTLPPLSRWHLCPSCQLGQKPGHPPLFLPLSRSTSKPSANVLDSTLSMHPDPTVTLHLHCPHPGPATILSHLDYHGSLFPGLLASHSKRDTVRTPGRSGHSPGPPCILGIKRQLLNTAWPQLLLGLHLPPLCSGSPCCPLTGLVTVPRHCASTMYWTHSYLRVFAYAVPCRNSSCRHLRGSLPHPGLCSEVTFSGGPSDYPSEIAALSYAVPSPYCYTICFFIICLPPTQVSAP